MDILAIINQFRPAKTYWLGYSGGLDSQVLLHLLSRTSLNVQAVYINHGLSPNAQSWEAHCAQTCHELNVEFRAIQVQVSLGEGQSPEAAARAARYQAFEQLLLPGDYLLTAHHEDDQAETCLLQLLRGAGTKGLASMPLLKPFARGYQLRPLLDYSRAQLLAYAQAHHLVWIEDETNQEIRFDRNFIRWQVLPLLKQRWPAASQTIARSTRHFAQMDEALDWFVNQELSQLAGQQAQSLSISKLLAHSEARQKLLLRAWFSQRGIPCPTEAQLKHMLRDVLNCTQDANPRLKWQNYELRRYRDALYVLSAQEMVLKHMVIPWDLSSDLKLPQPLGTLRAEVGLGQGLSQQRIQQQRVSIRFRQGGERCQPQGRVGAHPLKKLFQEWGIPPWLREQVPLLYVGEALAAVVGFCICQPFVAGRHEMGYKLQQN